MTEPFEPETDQNVSRTLPGLFFCNLSGKIKIL